MLQFRTSICSGLKFAWILMILTLCVNPLKVSSKSPLFTNDLKEIQSFPVYGVIDRLDDTFATILIEAIEEQWHLPLEQLPQGVKEGMWVEFIYQGDNEPIIQIHEQMTKEQLKRVRGIYDQLKNAMTESAYSVP